MKSYTISIADETKATRLLALLSDLSYVIVTEQDQNQGKEQSEKRFSLMNNPLSVENFRLFSREELHER
ncbi:MAG: hypothetical protein FWG90_12990 [Oscillospiraceae bacterium]|nr:hypothetical protein [Oscillospiraceae bacterium]